MEARKTVAEFFAGIGLVHEGLRRSGWKCIYANDIDSKKSEMYQALFGDVPYFHLEDVWKTDEVSKRISRQPFLATASFPCIDLSLAGGYRGIHGEHSSTYFGFVEVLRRLRNRKPKVVVLENVVGFLKSKGGAEFQTAACSLAEEGYYLDAFILDAKRFIPQSRPRVFVVGVHQTYRPTGWTYKSTKDWFDDWSVRVRADSELRPDSLIEIMEATDLKTGWAASPISMPQQRRYKLEDFIDTDDDQDWWDKEATAKHRSMFSERHAAEVARRRKAGGLHVGTVYRRRRATGTMAEVRFDGIAGCLRTPRGGSARQIVLVIDDGTIRFRWMSPREYARLQGVPEFPLPGNTIQALFGFGDAVCVPVIEWIDQSVLTPLYEEWVESQLSKNGNTARRATVTSGYDRNFDSRSTGSVNPVK